MAKYCSKFLINDAAWDFIQRCSAFCLRYGCALIQKFLEEKLKPALTCADFAWRSNLTKIFALQWSCAVGFILTNSEPGNFFALKLLQRSASHSSHSCLAEEVLQFA